MVSGQTSSRAHHAAHCILRDTKKYKLKKGIQMEPDGIDLPNCGLIATDKPVHLRTLY